jgi:hypothetical protein
MGAGVLMRFPAGLGREVCGILFGGAGIVAKSLISGVWPPEIEKLSTTTWWTIPGKMVSGH